jgi:serine protease Do
MKVQTFSAFLLGAVAVLALTVCTPGERLDSERAALAQEADESMQGSAAVEGAGLAVQPAVPQQTPTEVDQSIEVSRRTALVRASERVAPAVVSVNVRREEEVRWSSFWDDFMMPFAPRAQTRFTSGFGSGIIYHSQGYVLTNEHVVRNAVEIRVTLPDGRDLAAELIGADGLTDVAVLKVEEGDLPLAPMGSSQGLLIGEWAVAIGNPFAYLLSNSEPTVTAGVISAVDRHIIPSDQSEGFHLGMIQTDAAINPGNSGGPLVNGMGEVIGVNTSIFSRSGGSEGLGFAIPIDRALRVAEDLIQYGEIRRAWTGVDVEAVETDSWRRTRGVRVASVAPGSPGAEAGLSSGDRLVEANGKPLGTPLDLEAVLLDLRAGEEVDLVVEGRRDPYRLVTETLPTSRAERVEALEDLEVVTVNPQIRAERGLAVEEGALIIGISAERQRNLDLREGDVIVQINNSRIQTAEDAARAIRSLRPGSQVVMRWVRGRQTVTRYFYIPRG